MLVIIKDHRGNQQVLRALCDLGSQINLVSGRAAQMLRLNKQPTHMQIKSVNGEVVTARGITHINLMPKDNDKVVERVEAYIVPNMLHTLPKKEIDIKRWTHIRQLKLADESFYIPNKIDILLGAEFYGRIIANGLKKLKGAPTAQRTTFGWIVFGGYDERLSHAAVVNTAEAMVNNDELMQMLKRFWELDQIPTKKYRTSEEQQCEDIFTQSITTDETGRYVARMPVQANAPQVTGTYELAYARLLQMERKFARDPALKEKYIQFMRDYETLKHMELVPNKECRSDKAVYIPHHAAGTDKFRTVLDGSAKSKSGISINDIQLNGEKVQPELITILMRFRTHKIALTADIAKMYRQILIAKEQMDLQRILWRESPDQPVREYRLRTQTYGMKSAAYVCIRTMAHFADEFAEEYPIASAAVKNCFYVDDGLIGSHDTESAIRLHQQMTAMFARRHLELAKWNTNDPTMRHHIKSQGDKTIEINKDESTAVLGMHWNSTEDVFQYKMKNPLRIEQATKRTVSSDIARLYDPCGYLSCVMIYAKVILQDLWHESVDWDEPITGNVLMKWQTFAKELPTVSNVKIPRWIDTGLKSTKQIHGFADASSTAYGATFYLRQQNQETGYITTHLVFSKARVAPTKGSTIPKLELCACHLMSTWLEEVRKAHDVGLEDCVLWSDSMITIHWIGKSPTKLDVFVGNRVAEIHELTKGCEWRHVDTKSNPADLASRGIKPQDLIDNKLWWSGPSWLKLDKEKWPISKLILTDADIRIIRCHERKSTAMVNMQLDDDGILANQKGNLVKAYSSYQKLLRVTAYVLRFISIIRKKASRQESPPTDEEMIAAEELWIRHTQKQDFGKEIELIRGGQDLPASSKLFKLSPFLDNEKILRLSGRIKRSNMPHDTKHPIVLNGKSAIAKLLTRQAHKITLHGGVQLTQQYLRQRYWIIGGRYAVKETIHHCVPCFRQRKKTAQQLMAHLPEERITPGRPFESSAIDYAGPVLIKRYNASRTKIVDKGYIAVFVCTRTRAVHLELVSNMTTEAFIASFVRFSCRRGRIRKLLADNSTTFQGASNEQMLIHSSWRKVCQNIDATTEWEFIPPSAPHMGGLHEAAVKSAKAHLKRVIGAQQLTFEELATLLVQVEACLNSRPIQALTETANDSLALTPAHFLIGEPIIAPLSRDYTRTTANRLKNFQLMTKLSQSFWERWSNEYITALMHRDKWHQTERNIKEDDIVLLVQENLPPTQWALGRVTKAIKGDDGKVRVADVSSRGHVYRRPIVKLCLLPTQTEEGPAGEDVQN